MEEMNMATDSSCAEASEASTSAASCITKQRKKRKWDQPAESLIAAGLVVPGTLPIGVVGSVSGAAHPLENYISYGLLPSSIPAVSSTISQFIQGSTTVEQNAAALLQKLNQQPKPQFELIAREIVINDAEPTVRYRLTKRQTQEEIQKITGAIVITRGKYHPPNGLPDGEKPLYLHISAGAHLKDTAERIKAVDHAASMIDGFLKQVPNAQLGLASSNATQQTGGLVAQPLSACVFLGFEPDESLNIAERIRGPNDQYISHIMNVTGATVVLKGQGLGNSGVAGSDGKQQPIHLFLTSNNAKSFEEARILAENLLDTISAECGTSRISSSKVYNAVPPQQKLLTGVECSTAGLSKSGTDTGRICHNISSSSESLDPTTITSTSVTTFIPMIRPVDTSFQSNTVPYPQISVSAGTNYSGYGGIYPQATPLQQVALALKHAPTLHPSTTSIHASATTSLQETSLSRKTKPLSCEAESRRQRRKFQEQTVSPVGASPVHQRLRSGASLSDSDATKASILLPPQKLTLPAVNGMPLPPPKNIPIPSSRDLLPPPPRVMLSSPPKFTASTSLPKSKSKITDLSKQSPQALPAPLLQLMDYGEEEDDEDESVNEGIKEFSKREIESPRVPISKPFWSV